MNILSGILREALTILNHPQPAPTPIGVRVYRADTHTETNCELIHIGINHDGIDQYEIAGIVFRFGLDELRVDELPPHTSITFHTVDGPP